MTTQKKPGVDAPGSMQIESQNGCEAEASSSGALGQARGRHHEVACRYRIGRPPRATIRAKVRFKEVCIVLSARYGPTLPDDDAGREDIVVFVHHAYAVALITPGCDPRKVVADQIKQIAPWANADALLDQLEACRITWRAQALAKALGVTYAERTKLKLTTIGACDMTKAKMLKRTKARRAASAREKRRAAGAKPRAEYEARSLEQTKPWKAEGVSRRTWFRRQASAKSDVAQVRREQYYYPCSAHSCATSASKPPRPFLAAYAAQPHPQPPEGWTRCFQRSGPELAALAELQQRKEA